MCALGIVWRFARSSELCLQSAGTRRIRPAGVSSYCHMCLGRFPYPRRWAICAYVMLHVRRMVRALGLYPRGLGFKPQARHMGEGQRARVGKMCIAGPGHPSMVCCWKVGPFAVRVSACRRVVVLGCPCGRMVGCALLWVLAVDTPTPRSLLPSRRIASPLRRSAGRRGVRHSLGCGSAHGPFLGGFCEGVSERRARRRLAGARTRIRRCSRERNRRGNRHRVCMCVRVRVTEFVLVCVCVRVCSCPQVFRLKHPRPSESVHSV